MVVITSASKAQFVALTIPRSPVVLAVASDLECDVAVSRKGLDLSYDFGSLFQKACFYLAKLDIA